MSSLPLPLRSSRRLVEVLGAHIASPESIPFAMGDATAGSGEGGSTYREGFFQFWRVTKD